MEAYNKKWYVENKEDYYKFVCWKKTFGNMVVIDELYLIEGIKRWVKCGKNIRIIGFGVDKQFRRYL